MSKQQPHVCVFDVNDENWRPTCVGCGKDREVAELEAEKAASWPEVTIAYADLKTLARAVVDDAWGNGAGAYVISPTAFNALAAAVEKGDD